MSKQVKKILITGGTGFVGQSLCASLLKEGYVLYVLTRRKSLDLKKENREKIYIHNLSEINDIDIDMVINLAGESISQRWTEKAKQRIFNSRIGITRDLVTFMGSKKTKPTLFISGSAVGYYGTDLEKTFHEENRPLNVTSEFASRLCQAWEDEASQALALGVRTVLLRMGPVLEKGGGMLAKLLPSFYLGLGSQIGDGKQWLSWIDRDDLIALILFIMHHQNMDGPINATSPNPVTHKEFSLALAKALNRPCFLKAPEFIFKLIFGEMAEEIMLKGQKVLPTKAVSHGFNFSYPTLEESFAKIFRS